MSQKDVIDNTEGIYIVDAGAGTGKTYTITKRYANLLKQKKLPKDMLLVTFTRNAANDMKEKIINECHGIIQPKDLIDAPIYTFHAMCSILLTKYGFNAPKYLGIDAKLPSNHSILENEILEIEMFRRFFNSFRKERLHDFETLFKGIGNDIEIILKIIKKLCSTGIFPKKQGWYMNGEELIKGNSTAYKQHFNNLNEKTQLKTKLSISEIMKSFQTKLHNNYYMKRPEDDKLFDELQVKDLAAAEAFEEDRELLVAFIHDIYLDYIEYIINHNLLNYDFMIMFTFILLYEDHDLRQRIAYEYVMVDEFQDTDTTQFMMILLLMKTNNLCVVGDWKQGIYGFRNCTIENILQFRKRLKEYKKILNKDKKRLSFDIEDVKGFKLEISYRSSQKILDFSKKAFYAPGKKKEKIDEQFIEGNYVPLKAHHKELDNLSEIKLYRAEDIDSEIDLILAKINEIVDNPKYQIVKDGKKKNVKYKDIAVISRVRLFGLKLQKRGLKLGMPVNYEGGQNLYKTRYALLVISWLRILNYKHCREGWFPILEKAEYTYTEKNAIFKKKEYPDELIKFYNKLLGLKNNIQLLVEKIVSYYGYSNAYCNTLITDLQSVSENSFMSLGDIIHYMEESIDNTITIDSNKGNDAINVQTIHASKGLEYPVIFVADCNQKHFPSSVPEGSKFMFNPIIGIRSRYEYGKKGKFYHNFNNWKFDLVSIGISRDYDEFRRLLYVAITRCKHYLYLTASNPSTFFEEMGIDLSDYDKKAEKIVIKECSLHHELGIGEDYTHAIAVHSPHDFMDYHPDEKGRGTEFGNKMHHFAERIANGVDVPASDEEFQKVKDFILKQEGKLMPEIECSLPLENMIIRGIIDLVIEKENTVDIIDYKTDVSKLNIEEYRKQLSVYYHVVKAVYPKKKVAAKIYWTGLDALEEIDVLEIDEIIDVR